jgi:phosphate starvation-inducible PhoH-like protein
MDALKDEVSANVLKTWLDDKKVEFLSFEHMRGRTLSDCWVILDEAQNCTLSDLKLFLTRKGQDSVYVVAGDIEQVDGEAIPDSGLEPVIEMIDRYDLSPEIVEFDEDDVVRSADAKEWVQAFSRMSH